MAQPDGELQAIASELYAIEPSGFTKARTERVRDARARDERDLAAAIGGLRKPSAAAWAVNALAREHPEDLDALEELADELRELQVGSAAMLDERRRQAMAAALGHAREVAQDHGVPLGAAAFGDVESTLRAVLSDEAAAAAARSGMLVRPLHATGWEPVDVSGAVAVEGAGGAPGGRRPGTSAKGKGTSAKGKASAAKGKGVPTKRKSGAQGATKATAAAKRDAQAERRRERRAAAEQALRQAQQERDRAQTAAEEAASRIEEAESAHDEADAQVQRLQGELDDARAAVERARRDRVAAQREYARAQKTLDTARSALADAQSLLQEVDR